MKTATAKDLRIKTAALLDEVCRGHEVLITHRGKSVAILAPLPEQEHRNSIRSGSASGVPGRTCVAWGEG